MKSLALLFALATTLAVASAEDKKVAIGKPAPDFRIKDATGKEINLAELTAKGPVLVRLTCGCLGCDKELPYFQELHTAYKAQGLTSLAIFREPDAKVEAYVKEKKLNMLYAVDTKGESWKVFDTKTMPSNFLIAKGGQIVAEWEVDEPFPRTDAFRRSARFHEHCVAIGDALAGNTGSTWDRR